MSADTEWYVKQGGKVYGPINSTKLRQLATSGKINEESEVRMGDDGKWAKAKRVKGLFKSRELVDVTSHHVSDTESSKPKAVGKPSASVLAQGQAAPASVSLFPCPYCGEEIKKVAVKCRHCNEFLDGRPNTQASVDSISSQPVTQPAVNVSVVQNVVAKENRKRFSRIVAGLLSFLIPGLGQLYKGQFINALAWFFLTAIGYVAFIFPGIVLHLCCIVGAMLGDPYK